MKVGHEARAGVDEREPSARWVDDYIFKQSAWLYHKANSARGSDYARTVMMEPGVVETREEHVRDTDYARFGLVENVKQIVGGH